MSVRRSRSSLTSTKVFILSGLSGDERKDLSKKITSLGGIYFQTEDFKAHCTHVVCGKLSRSEKFLGACATGRWVLHPDYINQSVVAKDWLDEEQFEWCDENIVRKLAGVVPLELAYASRRWRFLLGDQKGAFSGWKVAVVVGANRSKALQRLLISGGAEVFNLKIPIKNAEKVANSIGYIFVSEQNIPSVAHLLEYGVLCIRPEFIGDYLIKDPPADPMDYLVQVPSGEGPGHTSSQGDREEASFLMSSQLEVPSPQTSSVGNQENPNLHPPDNRVPAEGNTVVKKETDTSDSHSGANSTSFLHVVAVSDPDKPGPSGAASQPGMPKSSKNLKKSELQNINPVVHSVQMTSKNTTSSTMTVASAAEEVGLNSRDLEKKHTVVNNYHLKKTKDQSKVKRTKENIVAGINHKNKKVDVANTGTKSVNNSDFINETCTSEKVLNILNIMEKLHNDAGGTSDIQSSKQLQNYKSEPACKDLIPKSRSLTVKSEVVKEVNKLSNEEEVIEVIEIKDDEESSDVVDNTPKNVPVALVNGPTVNMTSSSEASVIHQNVVPGDVESNNISNYSLECDKTGTCTLGKRKTDTTNAFEKAASACISQESLNVKTKSESRFPSPSGISAIKKKRSRQDTDLLCILREIKRQKVSHCEWRPTVFALEPTEVQHDTTVMPMTLTEIIHSSLEEKLSKQTAILDDLNSKMSAKYMPQAKTLHAIMVNLLLCARTDLEANKAYLVLMKILHLHPPTSLAAQEVYRKSLCIVDSTGIDEGEMAQGADWILLKECISNVIAGCLIPDSTGSQIRRNNELLLKYLVCLLEQDLQHLVIHHQHTQEMRSRPLLLRILWSPSYHVVFNSKCRELLELMTEVLICLRTNVLKDQREKLLNILKTVVWLVAMATECSRLSEGGAPEGLAALQCEKTLAFVHEIAGRIMSADVTDNSILQVIFSALQLPWQCVGVSQQLLNNMDDYLLVDEQVRDITKLTLSHVVSRYFFLLPKFNMRTEYSSLRTEHDERQVDSPARRQRNFLNSQPKKTECLGETNSDSTENIAKLAMKVNKKNCKGETPLHTACIKNDVNKLKLLLKTPGVDVNMKDNAGWTPLHEACNHGHIQCVQELLRFVPARTVEHYFKKDSTVLRKVDLLVKTEEGITPLHDAVLNNRLEVCRMLLQHGGPKLLSAVTCLNYTPLQLAETEEMFSLLSSFLPQPRRVSDSQEFSFSQDSIISVNETRTGMPPDHLYEEVTMSGDTRIFADRHAVLTFIYLVTCLLKNYIKAIDAESVREKIKEKLNSVNSVSKIRQKLNSGAGSQNSENSQEGDGHQPGCLDKYPISSQDSELLTAPDTVPFSCSESGNSSDKENHGLPLIDKNGFALFSSVPTKSDFVIKTDRVDNKVSKAYVRGVKRDLKVLRGLQTHVEMFRNHIEKICAKDDTELIDMEMLEISVLVDSFLS